MQSFQDYSPLALAFLGDGVFDLMVREMLLRQGSRQVSRLHEEKIQLVCAGTQARAADALLPLLTEEELTIYKRGRNAHKTVPRHTAPKDYHKATGLEALFGYLHLKGDTQRLEVLFAAIQSLFVSESEADAQNDLSEKRSI